MNKSKITIATVPRAAYQPGRIPEGLKFTEDDDPLPERVGRVVSALKSCLVNQLPDVQAGAIAVLCREFLDENGKA